MRVSESRGPLTLHLLGGASLAGPDGPLTGRATQRRRLALLAVLAAARGRPVSRDRLIALLWPESDEETARHLLRDSLYVLRGALGADAVRSAGEDLWLDASHVASDVDAFESALDAGDPERAVGRYAGPFLDGVHVRDAPEFERWTANERARLEARYAGVLELLGGGAEERGDWLAAAAWWRRLAAHDPLNGRPALRLAQALAAAGDRAGALQHLKVHALLLEQELGAAPDPAVAALTAELRREPIAAPAVDRAADRAAAVDEAPRSSGVAREPGVDLPSVDVPVAPATSEVSAPTPVSTVPPASATPPPVATATMQRRPARWAVAAGVALAVVAIAGWIAARRPAADTPRGERIIAVMPFRVSAADSSLAYLREGMIDLLGAALTGTVRTVNSRVILHALKSADAATDSAGPDLPPADAIALAQRLDADQVMLGEVVGRTGGQITLIASLQPVAGGAPPTTVRTVGPADSVPALVDRLAAQVLAQMNGERDDRAANLVATPLPALRAFLAGRAAFRRSQFEAACAAYAEAIRIDSTFALAGLELAYAAGGCFQRRYAPIALAAAWRGRDRLSARDRTMLDALAGPHYPARPTMPEFIEGAERVVVAAPDVAEAWVYLGDWLMHLGPAIGLANAHGRALAAFERGLALDSSYVPLPEHLVGLLAEHGDSARARRVAADALWRRTASEPIHSGHLVAAMIVGDTAHLRAWAANAGATPPGPDVNVVVDGAVEYGVRLDDADRAVVLRRRFAVTAQQRWDAWLDERLLALARGQPARAARAYDALHPIRAGSSDAELAAAASAAFDALVAGGDTALAARARRALDGATDPTRAPVALAAAALHDLARGDPTTAQRAVRLLAVTRAANLDDQRLIGRAAILVGASLAVHEGRRDAPRELARLDSALRDAAMPSIIDNALLQAGNLVAARLWERVGDVPKALAATRRRVFYLKRAAYEATYRHEEARLAAMTGDREAAIQAYRHYLFLRAQPEPALRAEVAQARAELARLERGVTVVVGARDR